MKSLILLTTLIIAGQTYACDQLEAQIISTVTQVKELDNACLVSVEIAQINEHIFCPLTANAIEANKIKINLVQDKYCPFTKGDELSGILVLGDKDFLELD